MHAWLQEHCVTGGVKWCLMKWIFFVRSARNSEKPESGGPMLYWKLSCNIDLASICQSELLGLRWLRENTVLRRLLEMEFII